MKKNFGLDIKNNELAAWLFLACNVGLEKVDTVIDMLKEGTLNEEHVVEKLKHDYVYITEEIFISELQGRYEEWAKKYTAFTKKEINYLKKLGISKEIFGLVDEKQKINSPESLATQIKGYVKGQDHVIDTLSVPFFQHRMSMLGGYDLSFKAPSLIIGPTGVGKSEIIRRFCDEVGCKFIRINSSDATPNSWRGLSIGQIIASQLGDPDDVSSLKHAVLVIHELDKVVTQNCRITSDSSTDFSRDFQRDLMRLFETNHNLRVEYGYGCDGKPQIYDIPVGNMLIIFDGCFNGLEDIVKKE
jgi:ATP-dependent protease Clp ATPase subunit